MGCDIHGVVERKVGSKWIAVRLLHTITADHPNKHGFWWAMHIARSRNYPRFAALAGVRGDGPTARGMPDDASDTARLLFETEGDHTPSWLPLREAAIIFRDTEYQEIPAHAKEKPWDFYFDCDRPHDHRLVFWFDS